MVTHVVKLRNFIISRKSKRSTGKTTQKEPPRKNGGNCQPNYYDTTQDEKSQLNL